MKSEILRMENVITQDTDITNLENLNLYIFQGEILGLIGVNEHGKEMLIRLMCQNNPIKFGRIYVGNQLVNSYHHSDGTKNKVYVIEQKSKLIDDLTVADNIFVLKNGFHKYIINPRVLAAQVEYLIRVTGIHIDPNAICHNLTEFERCVVEMMKAIVQGVKLIVVDDLSNYLSANDLADFNRLLRKMSEKKYAILYLGNHHQEIFPLCDRVAFMQDGKIIKVFDKKEMKPQNVVPYVISFDDTHSKEENRHHRAFIEFQNITTEHLKGINFSMYQGECIVLYDKSNQIQTEVLALFRKRAALIDGRCIYDGAVIKEKKLSKYLGKEVAIIGEDAIDSMLFYEMNYIDNLCFLIDNKAHKTNITSKIKKSIQMEYYEELGEELYVNDLRLLDKKSLYNLVYYRIHLLNPKVVIIVQPFAKADMYLRRHITHLIRILKRKGIAVIILAVSISDSVFVADSLLLIDDGKIKKTYLPSTFSQINENS